MKEKGTSPHAADLGNSPGIIYRPCREGMTTVLHTLDAPTVQALSARFTVQDLPEIQPGDKGGA